MSIRLYDENRNEINSVSLVLDGGFGDWRIRKVLIKNDDPTKYYTDLVAAVDNTSYSLGFMAEGYTIKLKASETAPAISEWNLVSPGNSVSLEDIGEAGNANTTTYVPIYIYTSCPANQQPNLISGINLILSGIERLA